MPSARLVSLALVSAVAAVLVAAPAGAATRGTVLFSDNFDGSALSTGWADGSTHGQWRSVYNGYGSVGLQDDGSRSLYEIPAVSTTPGVTHASLVRTSKTFGNLDLTLRMKTVRQLRTPTPNAWETAWALWNYTDDTHFYYLVLKPNGWELGKEDPAYPGAQRFLTTGSNKTFAVGSWHSVRVNQISNTITVWGDGSKLAVFTDNQRPYRSGAVALYNEDAHVRFDDVRVVVP